jgi:hypothetical protein
VAPTPRFDVRAVEQHLKPDYPVNFIPQRQTGRFFRLSEACSIFEPTGARRTKKETGSSRLCSQAAATP